MVLCILLFLYEFILGVVKVNIEANVVVVVDFVVVAVVDLVVIVNVVVVALLVVTDYIIFSCGQSI